MQHPVNIGANVLDMARTKSDQERGYIGAWMRRERDARGWTQEQVQTHLQALGYPVRAVYYRQVEAGKKPGPDFIDALVRLYGTEPEPPAQEAAQSTDMAAILELLRLQTEELKSAWAAIHYLADSIRETRVSPDEMAEVVVRVMEAREATRAQTAPSTSTGQPGSDAPRPQLDGKKTAR